MVAVGRGKRVAGVCAETLAQGLNVGLAIYATQLLAPIIGNTPPPHGNGGLNETDKRYVGVYEARKHMGRMLVGILNGNLVMVAPDDPNPYTGGTILQRTSEPHVFYMREADVGLSPLAGERLAFDTSSDRVVIGFHTDNMWFARIGPLAAQRHVSGMSVDEEDSAQE